MCWLAKAGVARVRQLVILAIACVFCGSTLFAAETSPVSEPDLEAVNSAIHSIQQWLLEANANSTIEEENLRQAEVQVMTTLRRVSSLQEELAQTRSEQGALQREVAALESEKAQQEELLNQLLRAAYMRGDQSLLKLLLNQEDPGESARMLHYYRLYSESQIEALQQFQATLDAIATTNSQLQTTIQALSQQQIALQSEATQLQERKQARQSALLELQNNIAARNDELEQLQIDQSQLQQLMQAISEAVERMPAPADALPFTARRGQLPRPVNGEVVQNFGSRYGDGNLRRQGILLAAPEGTQVRAVHSGRVVFADWLRGTGLLVIIDHGDGYMSLYGNNQALVKAAGDSVIADEIIAISGSSGGADNLGVYFEIRHHGAAQNPTDWVQSR